MARSPVAARLRVPDEPDPAHNQRTCEGQLAMAEAGHRIADAIERAVERFGPAADTIAGFADRADALCRFLKGKWPWIAVVAYLVLYRTINAAPDDVPKLIQALAAVAEAFR